MSFRSEVRRFIEEMRSAFVVQKAVIESQKEYILSLLEQNKDLHNRLMARDLPEFQTYVQVPYPNTEPTYDFETDEELAGTIVEVPEKKEA